MTTGSIRANLPPLLAAYLQPAGDAHPVSNTMDLVRNNLELQHRMLAAPDLRLLWG